MAITNLIPGNYARVDATFTPSSGSVLSSEPMNHVDDTENGNPLYTVYEITNPAKRYLKPDVVPVFQKKVHNTGSWVTITNAEILEVQYPGARIVLIAALNNDDAVQILSGESLATSQMYGACTVKISDKTIMKDCTCIGDLAKMQYPTLTEFSVALDVFYAAVNAGLTATMASGTNNSIVLEHQGGGIAGNSFSFEISPPGSTSPLVINMTGNDLVVTPRSTGAVINSTAKEIVSAINMNPTVRRNKIVAKIKSGETGLGIVTNYDHAAFTGGLDPQAYSTTKATKKPVVLIMYSNYSTDLRYEGYGYIEEVSEDLTPDEIIKQSITITGHGKLYMRYR